MHVDLSKNDLFVGIGYLESTLSAVSASNVANVYSKAINEILTNLHRPLDKLELFTQRDLEQIQRWNRHFPQKIDACVHEIVLQHAHRSPQSAALCSWDGNLTYHELDALSFQLAKHFVSIGIRPETLVPVCFRKSMYPVIAMIAIHRAGGAFVPLDPSHPQDRLKAIIEKAKANIVVASPETAHLFYGTATTVIQVSSSIFESLSPPPNNNLPEVRPDNAAFVLFTSGSTGKPKGIVQEHASVCTSSLAHGGAMNITSDSRVFQYAAFTFDVSMMDVFTTLIYGGCVCIPSEEDRMGNFTSVMNRMQVNWVLFTPSVASLINPQDVPTLRNLALGGEAVKQEHLTRWATKVRLFNCYGPAECAACSIGEVFQKDSRPANIGRQFGAGVNWVVDPADHNRILPIGAVGELVVEGPTLARGYLEDLAKTRAVFIKSPHWPQGAGPNRPRRLYKTGDLVRQNSDGTFEFTGRKDHQLKVRGQRVELGEVEHHLSTFPGVALSVAAMPQCGPYAKALVGITQLYQQHECPELQSAKLDYLSKEQLTASNFNKEELLQFMKSKLPPYMVPSHLLIVNKLPLSVSGKIDRKVVDAWLGNTTRVYESKAVINGRLESSIPENDSIALGICSKVLSMVAQPDSTFFASLNGSDFSLAGVGLDSIQVISLTMFIRQQYGVKIHLDTLVHPKATVRSVARSVETILAGGQDPTVNAKLNIMDTFRRIKKEALTGFYQNGLGSMNVFITGATGFLGSRILYQLCRDINIRKVVAHVRSQSAQHALQRIVKSARLAGWWVNEYSEKLEAWAGDLAAPRLGLNPDHWRRLCGYGSRAERITAVIHNGAAVNWNASFASLKATNVDSTVDLLEAASHSSVLSNFVFVSGGQQLKLGEDDDATIAEELAKSNGYAQSKFLSELVVKEYARDAASREQRISIVKPGYIIGNTKDGIANTDDFIWRLAASCIDNKSYNAPDATSWLFVSDVDRVAAAVSECCHSGRSTSEPRRANVVKILDGIPAIDFWSVMKQDLGYELYPINSELWIERFYNDIEAKGEKHHLWPLLQTVEEGHGKLGTPCNPRGIVDIDERRIKAAVRKNVEYLSSAGFLPKANGEKTFLKGKTNVGFTRSTHVVVKG